MSKLPIEQYLKEAFKRNKSAQTHKDVNARAVELIRRCWAENVFIVFTDGLRTNEDQAVLYGKGRSNYWYNGKNYSAPKERIVTNAKPGESMHNYGLALDFVTCDGYGKNIDWDVGPKWKRAAVIAKELGFVWGGDWKSFYDAPHIEYSNGYTAQQIKAGKWPMFKPFTPINLDGKPTPTTPLVNKEESTMSQPTYQKDAAPSEWAEEAVEWAKNTKPTPITDGTYLQKPATREEVLVMLHRLSKVNK